MNFFGTKFRFVHAFFLCGIGARSGVDLSMRELMEHAMLSAIATKMGLPENDSRVREVFHRESRRMAGGGGATGGGNI